jgi:hypothetical protein
LAHMLISLKLQNVLSAKQTCVLAFWAARSGATGMVTELSMRPDQSSGAYSRHFDKVVGCAPDDLDFYKVKVARRVRFEACRRWAPVATLAPHEVLAEEFASSNALADSLTEAKGRGNLPKLYTEHPWVQAAPPGEPLHPLSIYMDGVSYSRLDSVIVFLFTSSSRAKGTW